MHPENYPIEYIEGKVTFFGRDFIVTPDVLIPRLETEVLVRRARSILSGSHPNRGSQRGYSQSTPPSLPYTGEEGNQLTIVIDIGCGSGIIGTSVADLADEIIFLDISPEALAVAEQNFRVHFPDKKAQFIVSDLLSAFISPPFRGSQRWYPTQPPLQGEEPASLNILFLTNLPYIRAEDWINMSADTVHEPRLALFGGEQTGFEMYERLFAQITELQFSHFQLLCEFGFDQRKVAENVLSGYPWQYSFFTDYAGIERFGEVRF